MHLGTGMCVLFSLLLLASVFSLGKLHEASASHRVWPLWTQHRSLDYDQM